MGSTDSAFEMKVQEFQNMGGGFAEYAEMLERLDLRFEAFGRMLEVGQWSS